MAVQAGPSMALLEPGDVVECRIGPGFDAAVIAVGRLMAADVGVLEAVPGLEGLLDQANLLG
jgi:hypothetical protein